MLLASVRLRRFRQLDVHPLLHPVPAVSPDALSAGKRSLVWEAAWASLTGATAGNLPR
jgi:hypothetical protein